MIIKKMLVAAFAASLLSFGATAEPLYKVGSTTTGKPFTFLDVEANKIEGVMVDIMDELATTGGFRTDTQPIAWSALIPSLQAGKIDIMSAAATITPAREEVIDFSEPLFPYYEGLIVSVDDKTEYTSAKEFAGKIVGVMGGTTYYDYLKSVDGITEIKTYESIADIMRDIELGRLAAGFVDYPIIKYRLSQGDTANVRLVPTYKPAVVSQIALGVKKGNKELLDTLNKGIEQMKESGHLKDVLAKWNVN